MSPIEFKFGNSLYSVNVDRFRLELAFSRLKEISLWNHWDFNEALDFIDSNNVKLADVMDEFKNSTSLAEAIDKVKARPLKIRLVESKLVVIQKLSKYTPSINGEELSASELNEVNRLENLLYKYNKEEENIKLKSLNSSINRIKYNIHKKSFSEWLKVEKQTMQYTILKNTKGDKLRRVLEDIFESNLTLKEYLNK